MRNNTPPPLPGLKRRRIHCPVTPEKWEEEHRLDELCQSLLANPVFTNITQADLEALHYRIRNSVPILLGSGECAFARALIVLGEQIDSELESMGAMEEPPLEIPSPPPMARHTLKRLAVFDRETQDLVERMEIRHQTLRDQYLEMWENKMKEQYFKPSVRLQNLRQQAIDLSRFGDSPELDIAIDDAVRLENAESAQQQTLFQQDYDAAQARVQRKQDFEMRSLFTDRLKKRNLILKERRPAQSRPVSSAVTPRLRKVSERTSRLQHRKPAARPIENS
jgi:hypothetical protein